MYGMLLESIHQFVHQEYGEERWNEVLVQAGLRNTVFATHTIYEDSLMTSLANACAHVIGLHSGQDYLEQFGRFFVDYFSQFGYGWIMRSSGRHYRDFLNGIDNIHETMRFSYPGMISPFFNISDEDRDGCVLKYTSRRVGFTRYVIGQLIQCARAFYDVTVDVILLDESNSAEGCKATFRLNFDNTAAFDSMALIRRNSKLIAQYSHVSGNTFFKIYPYSMILDRDLVIRHAGNTLLELFSESTFIGDHLSTHFVRRRPLIVITWANLLSMQKVIFELESVNPVRRRRYPGNTVVNECEQREENSLNNEKIAQSDKLLLLKGKMTYMEDLNGIAFLCTPLLNDVKDMEALGLYINDLNMHDGSRDMVMTGWHHASFIEGSMLQQMEKSRQISKNLQRLDEYREKSDTLLYSMIPRQIATRLKNGEKPVDTCQLFHSVTVMFGYLLGFNELCADCPPDVLHLCIKSIFTVFDEVIERHPDVFKVETLGDAAYMVAGGVPESTGNHAVRIAEVALEFLEKVKEIDLLPERTGKNIQLQIRIGIHTGNVGGGVVGTRMPQYCLFGDTVNTASRMQSNGAAGFIHISESSHELLSAASFTTLFRGTINIKGKGPMNTFWLAGKTGDTKTTLTLAKLTDMMQESTINPPKVNANSRARLQKTTSSNDHGTIEEDWSPPSHVTPSHVTPSHVPDTTPSIARQPKTKTCAML